MKKKFLLLSCESTLTARRRHGLQKVSPNILQTSSLFSFSAFKTSDGHSPHALRGLFRIRDLYNPKGQSVLTIDALLRWFSIAFYGLPVNQKILVKH